MDALFSKITEWLKELLTASTMNNLTRMFESVNSQVTEVAGEVGTPPQSFQPGIFDMIRNLSESVIMPVAGIILTFIACYELIHLVTDTNNLANLDTWIFFKWVFKTAIAVLIISNTFNIIMAVFDVAQNVVNQSAGIISGSTELSADALANVETQLKEMELGPLFGMFLESFLLQILLRIMSVVVFVIVYGRMIEIYMMISLAPIPAATVGNREQSVIGQNYFRSLLALAFQGFLIMICVAIYAVLINQFALSDDILVGVWKIVGYTLLLVFTLFKTGSLAKSVFNAT